MIRGPNLLAAVFLALAPPAAAAKVTLVVANAGEARSASARAAEGVTVLAFDHGRMGDPIEKGRFLAAVQAADRVVAAGGGRACGWLGREAEGVPVHCVTPYDARQVLGFARAAGWSRVAAVHTAGYEKVYGRLRAGARERGIELVPVRVERPRDLPAALPRALKSVQAVWILGGPTLTEGAAFEYLVNATLARRVPLIAPGVELVARGAFLGAGVDRAALIRHATHAANALAKGAKPEDAVSEPPGGRLAVNQVLARRWGLRVPGGPP